ncbi:hypothetical protein [Actinopolyspora saharensis]|uniref:Uncharacterized protein n=1 Tax=Actinopolyspora saharensis TaxID=995062 RepID=A0A1H1GH63_9ACTN|nr:hypothetical protein [Actinopolyspora saharensis]SDR12403.1 hypothetical protein SAMN04489718_3642 [Actinopolyspora saharensis]
MGNWQDFVSSCEQGYDEDQFEYDHDLEDRDTLEKALNDPVLNGFAEMERLRREFAEDMHRMHGLNIRVVE